MEKIYRNHLVAILAGLAVVFLVVIIGYYIWGVGYLLMSEDVAEKTATTSSQIPQFNLDAASKLDYRGLLATSTTQ